MRFLCAPVGSGKTTLLRAYAERTPRTRYVEVARGAMWSTLRGAIGSARSASHVVLDGLDDADPAAIDALVAHLLSNVAAFPKLIIAGRARALLPVQNLLARGLAVDFGARDLAFQADEIEALADRLGLTYRDDDVAELLHATEGWAIAVGWILREATYAREGLRGAFERWAERRGHLLLEHVAQSYTGEADLRRAFLASLVDEAPPRVLAELDREGFPIARLRTRLRPYRVLLTLSSSQEHEHDRAAAAPKPLVLGLFGRFSCAVGDRQVAFVRRRDQNVLIYVALAPEARVAREELIEMFWPGVPRSVAAQGLRTTLSRLRRALAEAARADAETYLRIDANVALLLDHVQVDARRFAEHAALGGWDDARGNVESAHHHFRTAKELYTDRLLASEAVEAPLQRLVQEYETLFEATLSRLVELVGWNDDAERRRLALRLVAMQPSA
ncbi:MAG TPA: hypothetical protein VMA36_08280 [Candidatus Limnocylindria bacterium]|nr:hypothetical protein [Candidatus Limnocylindria bacterium]